MIHNSFALRTTHVVSILSPGFFRDQLDIPYLVFLAVLNILGVVFIASSPR